MYNFSNILLEDEKIIYQGQSVKSIISFKDIFGMLFIILFFSFVMFIVFVSDVSKVAIIFFLIISLIFILLSIYGIFNMLVLKRLNIKGNCYCLTNKRILKYVRRNNELIIGNIDDYSDFTVELFDKKENVGDLEMMFDFEKKVIDENIQSGLISNFVKMKEKPIIVFEGIYDVYNVLKIIKDLKNSNNIEK